ncbi:acetyltransferase (GNAT) family protein [Gelidibacter algens]|uniref:Acetyltransferase (GNAT) family protein n=1 Tax=Gelidibacter algens TaxID=49280 RepID=A0A1A7QZB0_9FLAO|nr:GNAT family N-acetyltransferase [Gelidibacter algens]OBX24906.1 GNAT family acetyltransferase [Gelidibacter algens]RAJ27576.1 acetyltransferase (GNAT) family protein [Gelidibacter algens]
MIDFQRTNPSQNDFIDLVRELDADLKIRDGDDHSFYDQFNKIQNLKYCLVAYEHKVAVGCGAIKPFDAQTMEVKRMFVLPDYRGKGIAAKVLKELEIWAKELDFSACVLETGVKQPEAIALYKKCGYQITDSYGQYMGIDNSICFNKNL